MSIKNCLRSLAISLSFSSLWGNTITVTTAEDQLDPPGSGGPISLREAIRDAGNSTTQICFDSTLSNAVITLNPTLGPLRVTNPDPGTQPGFVPQLTINASTLTHPPRISAPGLDADDQAALIISGREVRIRNLVIENSGYAGILVDEQVNLNLEQVVIRHCHRSAVHFQGLFLTMTECEIHGNVVRIQLGDDEAPAVWFDNGFTLTMNACSIYQNAGRGLLCNVSTSFGREADLNNVTIAENSTTQSSNSYAGAYFDGPINTDVRYCTIVDNAGGGLGSTGGVRLASSIIARNRSSQSGALLNVGDAVNSRGYNLSDDAPAALDEATDQTNTDPEVTRIGYYGGHAPTCYPLVGSPALGQGNENDLEILDGRGYLRGVDSRNVIDAGAVEIDGGSNNLIVSTSPGNVRSLQNRLVNDLLSNHRTVTFDQSMSGQTFLFSESVSRIADGEQIVVDASNLAEAPILAEGSIYINKGASLSLINVKISDTFNIATQSSGNLGLNCAEITNATVTAIGSGRVVINECHFRDFDRNDHNNTSLDSNLRSDGTAHLQVWNSTFSNNENLSVGTDGKGAAILSTSNRPTELFNVTFDNNRCGQEGAAIYHEKDLLIAKYCSFLHNRSLSGALAFGDEARSKVTGCLFVENKNLEGSGFKADTSIPAASLPNHLFFWNGTTEITPRPDGFEAGNQRNMIGGDITLSDLDFYGGKVPTRPMEEGSTFIGIATSIPRRALDARGELPAAGPPTLGAVTFAASPDLFASITEIQLTGTSMFITVTRTPGSSWLVEAGQNLNALSPTGITIPAGASIPTVIEIPLPDPIPDHYFARLVSE